MNINAPEKLYIDFRDRKESTWRCAYTEKALANDIEYIRKDAFIEKAENYLRNTCQRFILTEKDIDDFVKYMKEE